MPFSKLKKSKKNPRVILVGSFGAGNIGDELILAGFLKELKRKSPQTKVTVLGGDPHLIQRWHGVAALPLLPCGMRSLLRKDWWQSLRAIHSADSVIFPGGGLFTDSESIRAVLLWGLHILIARYYWKPVYLLGQSIGPLRTKFGKSFTKFCLGKAEWIRVRDSASERELHQLHLAAKKIQAGFDSAFWLVNRLPKIKKMPTKGVKKILVSVRNFPKLPRNIFSELAKALDQLCKQSPTHITFTDFGRGDVAAYEEVKRLSRHGALWIGMKPPKNAEGVLQLVKKFDLVIGMRLHSLISARLTGVPSIGIAYSPKVAEFQKSQNQKYLETKNFSSAKILKLLS